MNKQEQIEFENKMNEIVKHLHTIDKILLIITIFLFIVSILFIFLPHLYTDNIFTVS